MSDDSESLPPAVVPAKLDSREGVEYIADVTMRVLDAYTGAHVFLEVMSETPELIELRDEMVPRKVAELGRDLLPLAHAFERVSRWWVADRPPPCAPGCVSVVDAVIQSGAYLIACFGAHPNVGPEFDRAQQHQFAPDPDEDYQGYPQMAFEESRERAQRGTSALPTLLPSSSRHNGPAYLRCECANMLRRGFPAVPCRLEPRRFSFNSVMQMARIAVRLGPDRNHKAKLTDSVPLWLPATKVLMCGRTIARNYATRAAPTQWKILDALQAAGWPTTPVHVQLGTESLNDTIRSFNTSVEPNTIRLMQTGTSVTWHRPGDACD